MTLACGVVKARARGGAALSRHPKTLGAAEGLLRGVSKYSYLLTNANTRLFLPRHTQIHSDCPCPCPPPADLAHGLLFPLSVFSLPPCGVCASCSMRVPFLVYSQYKSVSQKKKPFLILGVGPPPLPLCRAKQVSEREETEETNFLDVL